MHPTELDTLKTLWTASSKCFGLDLHDAYRTVPQEHLKALQAKKLWFVASSTQGNITEAGVKALSDGRDKPLAKYAAIAMGRCDGDIRVNRFEGETSWDRWVSLTTNTGTLPILVVSAKEWLDFCRASLEPE